MKRLAQLFALGFMGFLFLVALGHVAADLWAALSTIVWNP